MSQYLFGRAIQAILVLLGVTVVVFALRYFQGDPTVLLLSPDATRAEVAEMSAHLGLDQPIWLQYWRFLVQLLQGDLGYSWRLQGQALDLVLERLPSTTALAVSSLFISLVISIPMGLLAALKPGSAFDTALLIFSQIMQSTPVFWFGLMLIMMLAVQLRIFPTSGAETPLSIVLPSLTLGLGLAGRDARILRASMLEVFNEDYIRSARAKGLPERRVVMRHALKNGLLPLVTVVALELGTLLGGAVIVEAVFAWPGMGLLAYQAVAGGDYPVVQAVILLSAFIFTFANFTVDFLYTFLDPRISIVRT